ncbi:MAG: PAS domain S-box protein [Hyphomicrobiales bacterium]
MLAPDTPSPKGPPDWLQHAVTIAGVVGFSCDVDKGVVSRSSNSMSVLGVSDSGHSGEWSELIVPEDRAYFQAAMGGLTPQFPRYEVEYRIRHGLTGFRFWVLDRGEAEYDEEGNRTHVRGAIMDLSTRIRGEVELRQGARLTSVAFAAARMGAWHYDPAHRLLACSDELLAMFSIPRSEFDGNLSTFEKLIHPDDVRLWNSSGRGPFFADDSFEVEFRGRGAGGEVRWFLSRGEVARRMDGTVIESYGVMIDITERKQAEQAAAHLAAIITSSEDAILSKTMTGIVTSWNRAAERMFGFTAEEIIGAPITHILLPEAQSEEAEILATIARGESIAAYESRRMAKDGRVVHVSLSVSPIRNQSGHVIGASTIARDLTDRLRHLQVLRQSEERLRLALKGARAGAWDYDAVRNEMHWSQEMFELYGLDPGSAVPDEKARLEMVEPSHRMRVDLEFRSALKEGRSIALEYPIVRSDGTQTWTMMSGDIFLDPDGTPLAARGICQDITERKNLQSRQAILLRELSHRVKNSLAIVLSIARQTLHTHSDPKSFVEAFEGRVRSLAQSHNLLTEGELASARVSDIIRGQLSGIVGDIDDRLELKGPDVALTSEHATQLGMILHELATNAVKHGALSVPTGRILIRWLASRGRLCLTWRERGGPPIEKPPEKSGFGTRLIDSSSRRVSRRFERDGLTARFELRI